MPRLVFILLFSLSLTQPALGQTPTVPEEAYVAVRPLIADQQRVVTPNGIQTLEAIRIGGMEQWVSIRGTDRDNPILIYVHGGPGSIEMGRAWPHQRGWEEYFTVVQWDQRGAGKTLRTTGAEATRPTLSRARMADDLVELIAAVRDRLGPRKVIVLGHSWGSVIGLDAAMKRPDWVSVFLGVGPVFDFRANEEAGYRRLLDIARERDDAEALAELEALAPYPGAGPMDADRLAVQRKWVGRFGGLAAYRDNADFYFRAARLSPDYDLADRQAIDAGSALSVEALLRELSALDQTDVTRTGFPVVLFLGRHDLTTPPVVSEAWLAALEAPHKQIVWFEHSAHLPPHEEPGRFLTALIEQVRPLAVEPRP